MADEFVWSYTSGTSDTPLIGMTIGDTFDQTVERFPDNEALVSRHQNLRYTYRQLQQEVNRFAKGLMAHGLKKGSGSASGHPIAPNGPSANLPQPKSGRSWSI